MKMRSTILITLSLIMTPVIELMSELFHSNIGFFIFVGIFIVIDTVLGITIAIKNRQADSNKFIEMFFVKLVIYVSIIMLGVGLYVSSQSNDIYQISKENGKFIALYPIAFIFVKETWSILTKISTVYPGLKESFKSIIKKIDDKTTN